MRSPRARANPGKLEMLNNIKTQFHKIPYASQLLARIRLTKVAMENIRCQVKPFSAIQGFSGRTIDHFPPCKFYRLYLTNPDEAYTAFADWLYDCLIKLNGWQISVKKGGWKDGTLVGSIYEVHRDAGIELMDFSDADEYLVRKGIDSRVKHYFSLLDSIKENGYHKFHRRFISTRYNDRLYYLQNGHHRTAVLYTLEYKEIYVRVIRTPQQQ